MDVNHLLNGVKNGTVSIEEAEAELKQLPYEDLGFAKLDHHRSLRSGFPEVIFCQGKTCEQVTAIFERFVKKDAKVLATRASKEQYEDVKVHFPDAVYLETPRLITYALNEIETVGRVAVCTAGTSDTPVAEEAACVAEFFGANVDRFYDVGVAGIHRLLTAAPKIREANVVVAIAGMEGALASVIGGLVDKPVIAVPTSVGYGTNFGGVSALLTMLNSCAEGISVVNIDNGFGAGYLAAQINRLIEK